ncbi:proliferation-associated protein 1 [Gigaspora margarita]|uniref:Proliferation-associated protein 1 n=1 Tax=Gigaspora margarita TaxID=4874 RepID=A0A8H3XAW6_GIGMA|nr:proliferation-associated protein 1 [Gigaspora margarita]
MAEQTEVIQTVQNPDVVQKYQMAAEVSNRVLKVVIDAAVEGARILDLCALGDKSIEDGVKNLFAKDKKISKGIAFPTCVSVNQIICHFSPLPSDPEGSEVLKNGDLAKIQLGAQIDGYAAIVATTIVVGASKDKPVKGRLADVITAAHLASEAALRLVKPGLSNDKVTETIQKIAKSFDTNSVEGMLSYQQERNDIEGKKQIILNPNEAQRRDFETVQFGENEVYGIDILISTGEGKPKASSIRTTVYKKTGNTYSLKMKTSRLLFTEISQKFGTFPFPLRALEDEKKARLGIAECANHALVTPYDVYQGKEGDFVAQFFNTVLLTKNGSIKITNTLYDSEVVQSDKKVEDEEIISLLATSLKPKKKNKKKKDDKNSSDAVEEKKDETKDEAKDETKDEQ